MREVREIVEGRPSGAEGAVLSVCNMARVTIRNWVSFRHAMTAAITGTEVPAEPWGKEVAEALAARLKAKGLNVTAPENYEDWAWDFDCRMGSRVFSILFSMVDDGPREWAIWVQHAVGRIRRLFGVDDSKEMMGLVQELDGTLKSDPSISEVRWYTEESWDHSRDTDWSDSPL